MSQFSDCDGKITLARYIDTPKIYPAGRLDYDSEGLLLLSNDGEFVHRLSHPKYKFPRHYEVLCWFQMCIDIPRKIIK